MTKFQTRIAIGLAAGTAMLAIAAPAMAQDDAGDEEILVTAQRNNQTKVTGGGDVGVFGTKLAEDIPFNIRSYNEALILNQQPDSLGEVLENDPTIRTALGFGIAGEVFVIRGFDLSSDDVGFDGLYGITPRQIVAPELVSSVQVINGASAFLNGAAPGGSGIGGSVNILPKKAERDVIRGTLGYTSASHFSGAVDVARRFGADQQWGLRLNASARRGDIAIDDEFHSSYVLGAVLDYDNGPLRAALSLNYQRFNQSYWRGQVGIGAVVPRVPEADTNYSQPWSQILTKDYFGTFSVEYDLSDQAMLYAKVGARDGREDQTTASITVSDAVTGAASGAGSYVPREDNNEAATAGIRIKLEGGGVSHEINAGASVSWQLNRNAYDFAATGYATNLYDPVVAPAPTPGGFVGGDLDDVFPIGRSRVSSVFVSNTLGFWDDRILLTGGVRLQEIKTTSYSYFGGARSGGYKESAATPVFGLVVKPVQGLSLYANRIEGLIAGATAPAGYDHDNLPGTLPLPVVNAGAALPPVKSTQYEVGGKLNFGRFNAGVALFRIDKPNSFVDPVTIVFGNYGTQRNKGVEITLDGEPVDGLRIISGLTILDAKLRRTENGVNEGNDAVGVPELLANANVEWDLPFLPELTLVGRVVHTGKQAVNQANTLELGSWTRFDLGARYVALVGETPLTLRFNVDNVADKRYWATAYNAFSAFGARLLQGGPRTFKASASIEF
ncbi:MULTISPECIES: TonB-dependent receptor [unclassified Sphingopyxis]|uniref:TonB-dependent receptor n=1 Tax=unclassified Sphingopyxis TaxID=2614943 RepID=UPI000735E159|nr:MULTISPECIES: TonB-dependent receptor [unclassified Sphingopyxis]KTE30417.1 TonB-dependent receptor [Sphingopyxis sp. HIX]KTE84762.1 TonB-dependent receptor [Sphingopyxis sp. HXXIV]